MDDKIPCGPIPSCCPQSNRMRLVTQHKCPGMGRRGEERKGPEIIGSVMSGGALNCRPGLLRSKVAHILQWMVLSCCHRWAGPQLHRCLLRWGRGGGEGRGEKEESHIAHEYCWGVKENMLISHGSWGWEQVSFANTRKTEIQLNAFFRQQVVSPSPTGMGLDFLGVTTKARFPAHAAKWTYQPRMQRVGCSRPALRPLGAQPYRWWTHFVLGQSDSGACTQGSQSMSYLPQNSEGSNLSAFAVLFGGSMAEHGSWGGRVARKNTFLKSPFDS